ncbi:MAG TPA: hypothetical protein VK171_06625, partial [Fimbriimonas sp.]|nr:hypothetical protein [Fimbriimonas sp.]
FCAYRVVSSPSLLHRQDADATLRYALATVSVDWSKLESSVPTIGPYGMLTTSSYANLKFACNLYRGEGRELLKWHIQSYVHHIDNENFPYWGDDIWEEQEWVEAQMALWERIFAENVPNNRIVIEQTPFELVTWYQAWPGTPTEEDPHWYMWDGPSQVYFTDLTEFETALDDIELFCTIRDRIPREQGNLIEVNQLAQDRLSKWYEDITPPKIDPRCPGIMLSQTRKTGKQVCFAGKVQRKVIGPENSPESTESEFLPPEPLSLMTKLTRKFLKRSKK